MEIIVSQDFEHVSTRFDAIAVAAGLVGPNMDTSAQLALFVWRPVNKPAWLTMQRIWAPKDACSSTSFMISSLSNIEDCCLDQSFLQG